MEGQFVHVQYIEIFGGWGSSRGTIWGWAVSCMPQAFTPGQTYPLSRRVGRSRNVWSLWRRHKLLAPMGNRTNISRCPALYL